MDAKELERQGRVAAKQYHKVLSQVADKCVTVTTTLDQYKSMPIKSKTLDFKCIHNHEFTLTYRRASDKAKTAISTRAPTICKFCSPNRMKFRKNLIESLINAHADAYTDIFEYSETEKVAITMENLMSWDGIVGEIKKYHLKETVEEFYDTTTGFPIMTVDAASEIFEIADLCASRNLELKMVDGKVIIYQCECGLIKTCDQSLFSIETPKCFTCNDKVNHKLEAIRPRFESKGLELLSTVYVNNYTPMEYKCKFGHRGTVAAKNVYRGCGECNLLARTPKQG
jgi:hypothetical protein